MRADRTMFDLTDTRKPPHLMSGNRCDDCLTASSRASLDLVRQENPDIRWFGNTGVCSACGETNDVYDVPHLLVMRFHGLLRRYDQMEGGDGYVLNMLRTANPETAPAITMEKHRAMVAHRDQLLLAAGA